MKLRDFLDELKRFDPGDEVEFLKMNENWHSGNPYVNCKTGIDKVDVIRFENANHERGRLVIKLV